MKPAISSLVGLLACVTLAPAYTVDKCVCKVQMVGSCGSGTCISPSGYVLTAAHVTDGHGGVLIFPDGTRYQATLFREDHRVDLAVLKFDAPAGQPWLPVAEVYPRQGEQVWGVGYPGGGPEETKVGPLQGITTTTPSNLRASYTIHPGDSGGLMCNSKGELVGVQDNVYTEDPHEYCNAVPLEQVRGFLGLSWGRSPAYPGSGNCPGGICPINPYQPSGPPSGGLPSVVPPASPATPAPAVPLMPPAAVAPATPAPDIAALQKQITEIEDLVKAIKPVPGPAGPKGDAGEAGKAGPAGVAGKDGVPGAAADPAAVNNLQAQQAALQARVAALENKLQNLSGSVQIQVQPAPGQ